MMEFSRSPIVKVVEVNSHKLLTFLNPKAMTSLEVNFNAIVEHCSGYGKADAKLKFHICGRETDHATQGVYVPGAAPFTLHLFLNNNPLAQPGFAEPYRIIENIPACTNPDNFNVDPNNGETDINCIVENLPAGSYSGRIFDSQVTDPENNIYQGEARFWGMNFIAVQPPKVKLAFDVDPGGIETTVKVLVGETTNYGTEIECGIMNGNESTPIEIEFAAHKEVNGTVTDFLLPNTTYHWKAVAENTKGVTSTEDLTFVTPDYTSAPQILNPRIVSIV